MRIFLRLTILLLASPAAHAALLLKDVRCENKANEGWLILSGMLPDADSPKYHGAPRDLSLTYNKPGASALTDKSIVVSRTHFLAKQTSDFEHEFGRLQIIPLEAGTYEFRYWGYVSWLNEHWTAYERTPLKFEVAAGRGTYVGSFKMWPVYGKNVIGFTVGNARLSISDRSPGDLELVSKKCPNIDPSIVDAKLLDLSPW